VKVRVARGFICIGIPARTDAWRVKPHELIILRVPVVRWIALGMVAASQADLARDVTAGSVVAVEARCGRYE
jgi:hypothetical protein